MLTRILFKPNSLLNAPTVKGTREKRIVELLKPLEEAMGGKVFVDSKSGRFYLNIVVDGKSHCRKARQLIFSFPEPNATKYDEWSFYFILSEAV